MNLAILEQSYFKVAAEAIKAIKFNTCFSKSIQRKERAPWRFFLLKTSGHHGEIMEIEGISSLNEDLRRELLADGPGGIENQ